jgi:hypothetical protein
MSQGEAILWNRVYLNVPNYTITLHAWSISLLYLWSCIYSSIFWDVVSRRMVEVHRRFEQIFYLLHQGWKWTMSNIGSVLFVASYYTFGPDYVEVGRSSETSVLLYCSKCHHIPSTLNWRFVWYFYGVVVRVPGYTTEMYCVSCEVRTEFLCYVEESRPPLWSSGQSFWLQIHRSGFDFWRYQIFWEVVGLERGPFSLVSTTEELLERKSSGSGLENREYGRRDPSRRYSSLADSSHGI